MSAKQYNELAYKDVSELVFGTAKHPVTLKNGMVIGGGTVYPEVNFTLPPMEITAATMPKVLDQYKQIIDGICGRARDLAVPGFVAEIEILPPCTFNPKWGADVCKVVADGIKDYAAKYGIKGAVRYTPVDIREGRELQNMYKGSHWDRVLETCDLGAKAGADFLAIESIGGKDVHDEALMYGDIKKSVFAMGILACRDVVKLWTEIVRISKENNILPSGETACAFANTSFALAHQGLIPKVLSAAVRVMAAVRSVAAVECGAVGPDKDCGYEGIYTKIITGTPISMEGRVAAVAHLSGMGNIAQCACDLWSNESIQNIKVLSAMAPTASFEQLVFDVREMNGYIARGKDAVLLHRDVMADSDSKGDPQAYILRPDVAFNISKGIVAETGGHYARTKKAAELALKEIEAGFKAGKLDLAKREQEALKSYQDIVAGMTTDEGKIIAEMVPECEKLNPAHYDAILK